MKIKALFLGIFFCSHILANGDPVYSELCYKGRCPTTRDDSNYVAEHHVFIADVNCRTKFADWVAYVVDKDNLSHNSHKRIWQTDTYIPKECTTTPKSYYYAYQYFRYEHGHLAPLASFSANSYWMETNYLSNIAPQVDELNEGPWANLESHVRDLARMYGNVYVITGPIYRKKMNSLPNEQDAIVPSDYYKVIIIPGIDPKTESYILPQNVNRHEDYYNYKVSVNEVEKLTGIIISGGK